MSPCMHACRYMLGIIAFVTKRKKLINFVNDIIFIFSSFLVSTFLFASVIPRSELILVMSDMYVNFITYSITILFLL